MKLFFSLSLLTTIALLFAGCGGRPSTAPPAAKLGTPIAPADTPPASSGGNNSSGSNSGTGGSGSSGSSNSALAPAPAPSALPAPPANATVFDQVQNTTDNWASCSVCAQGTNDTTNFWMAPHQGSPSMTGSSRQFYVGGPQWTNALFSKTYFSNTDATHFLWEFSVYWDETSMANIWTAEFDFWQSVGGKEFMIGNQCNFGDGYWDIWDSAANKWLHSDIPCKRMAPGQWHHVQLYLERLGTDHYRYDTLVLDGQAHDISRTFDPNSNNWKDSMGIQWQLDQSSSGVDIHEWIDNVKLTVW